MSTVKCPFMCTTFDLAIAHVTDSKATGTSDLCLNLKNFPLICSLNSKIYLHQNMILSLQVTDAYIQNGLELNTSLAKFPLSCFHLELAWKWESWLMDSVFCSKISPSLLKDSWGTDPYRWSLWQKHYQAPAQNRKRSSNVLSVSSIHVNRGDHPFEVLIGRSPVVAFPSLPELGFYFRATAFFIMSK